MAESVILLSWALSGGLAAWARPEPGSPRMEWAPVAVFFGPFWLLIAHERLHSLASSPTRSDELAGAD